MQITAKILPYMRNMPHTSSKIHSNPNKNNIPHTFRKKTYTNSNKIKKIWDNMSCRRSRVYKYKKLNKTKQRPDECQSAKLLI